MPDYSEEDFFDDFGAPPLTEEKLKELDQRSQERGDAEFRQLVSHVAMLRNAVGWLLKRIEATEGLERTKDDVQLKLVRSFIGL